MYFVVVKSDLYFSMGAVCFSCTDKLYGYMIHGEAISMWNIYLPFSLTTQSGLCSLSFSSIYLKPSRNIIKFQFFENQLAKPFFSSLFPNVELFIASYPPPRSPLDNFCPRSKAVWCDGSLNINTFHSWRIRIMHLILLETVFDSHLVNFDSQ